MSDKGLVLCYQSTYFVLPFGKEVTFSVEDDDSDLTRMTAAFQLPDCTYRRFGPVFSEKGEEGAFDLAKSAAQLYSQGEPATVGDFRVPDDGVPLSRGGGLRINKDNPPSLGLRMESHSRFVVKWVYDDTFTAYIEGNSSQEVTGDIVDVGTKWLREP